MFWTPSPRRSVPDSQSLDSGILRRSVLDSQSLDSGILEEEECSGLQAS